NFILDMQISPPISSFAILLWLPQHEEIAKYIKLDHSLYHDIYSIITNEIIALSNTEFFEFRWQNKYTLRAYPNN
ncbi:MAG: hypothetical protein L6406_11175, partial [Desulfobacterales bacterium]|nr:hypothetical protein [Desulfobacterales bacterium]